MESGRKGPVKGTGHLESEGLLSGTGGWSVGLVWQGLCLVYACDSFTGPGTQEMLNRWGPEKARSRRELGFLGQPHMSRGSLGILG